MATYHMTCSCGHELKTEAKSKAEAVAKLQGVMDEKAIAQHFREKHRGAPVPPVAQIHKMIADNVVAA